jgi:endogenous inhibitor of DNA gyrase (YacG/DUF329 family)
MTETEKTQIHEMRRHGCTYRHIASALALKEGTVKTYCVRATKKGLIAPPKQTQESSCKQCGTHIEQVPKRKKKVFCSKACSQKWWSIHLYLVDPSSKALYHFTCSYCQKSFTAYGNPRRKFCSHDCYIKSRYYQDTDDGR